MDDINPRRLIGGVNQVEGGWEAVIEVHHRCHGYVHQNCIVAEKWTTSPLPTQEEAVDMVEEAAKLFVETFQVAGSN